MRFLGRASSSITASIVAIALAVSPVMAQNATAPPINKAPQHDEATSGVQEQQRDSVAAVPEAAPDPKGDPSDLPESITKRKAVPAAAGNAPLPSVAPDPGRPSSETSAPGESKWIILATLIATGAGIAIYYLLRGLGR